MASRAPSRWLLALLLLRRAITTRPRRPSGPPSRILIAHHLYLGDTLMLTPLLAKLRRQYPEAQIVMTTPKAIVPLYQHRPYGVDALPYDPRDIGTLIALVRQREFDLAFVPGDNRNSWLARALGARWIVAFAGDRPAYKSWPVNEFVQYPNHPAAWGDMVADMVAGPAAPVFNTRQWPAPTSRPFTLPRTPYCVLHVGASSLLKLWPAANWMSLANELERRGYTVVWSAGPKEERYIKNIDPEHRYSSFAGSLELPQLWHLLANANLLISPDTGVAHLGRVVGIPTVVLFGPGSSILSGGGEFWKNSPSRSVTIDPFVCRNQHALFKREIEWVQRCYRKFGECTDNQCMKAITGERVLAEIDSLMRPPSSVDVH